MTWGRCYYWLVWLAGTLGPVWAFFGTELPKGHRPEFHAIRTLLVADAWCSGAEIIPRWSPELCYGLGSPLFTYYGWFSYAVAAGIRLLTGMSAVAATHAGMILFALVQGGGAWMLGRELGGRRGAWMAWALYTVAPYILVNLYVRNHFAEYAAGALAPWALYFMIRTVRGRRPADAMGAAGVMALLIFTHNLTAFMINPLVALIGGVLAATRPRGRRLAAAGRVGAVLVFALLLAAHFWVPVVLRHGDAQLERVFTGYFEYRHHFVYPRQLFDPAWRYGASVPGPRDGMPLQLGLAHWGALALCPVLWVVRPSRRRRLAPACLFGSLALGLLFLTTTRSAPVWEMMRLLQVIHFPWLLLLPATLMTTACGAVAASALFPVRFRGASVLPVAAAVLTGLVFSASYCRPEGYREFSDARLRELLNTSYVTTADADEYRPATAVKPEEGQGIIRTGVFWFNGAPLSGQPLPPAPERRTLTVTLPESHGGGTVLAPVYYFPGWSARADGIQAETFPGEPHGLLCVRVPAGARQVVITRSEGAVLAVPVLVSLVSLAALIALPWALGRMGWSWDFRG